MKRRRRAVETLRLVTVIDLRHGDPSAVTAEPDIPLTAGQGRPTDVEAAEVRSAVYDSCSAVLDRTARALKKRVLRPADVLEDIKTKFAYEPWDIAFVAALTAILHPRTQVGREQRTTVARITKERRRLERLRDTFARKLMTGDGRIVDQLEIVLAPRTAVGHLYSAGRTGAWVLDHFVAAVLVIFETRARRLPVRTRVLQRSRRQQATEFITELLLALGIDVREEGGDVTARVARCLRRGLSPPPPDDRDPLGWMAAMGNFFRTIPVDREFFRCTFAMPGEPEQIRIVYTLRAGTPPRLGIRILRPGPLRAHAASPVVPTSP